MSVKASITIDGIAALKPKQIRDCARVALKAVGDRWIKNMLPRHFLQSATARYGYAPRDPVYRRRKRLGGMFFDGAQGVRSIKEDKPLVWSGRSRAASKHARTEAKALSATYAYAEVVINAPALNYLRGRINARKELDTHTQGEMDELAVLFVRVFEQEIERLGRTTRRRLAA